MINVTLPDGRTIAVDADDPQAAARAAKQFMDREATQGALDSLGTDQPLAPSPPQSAGNAVSRPIRNFAQGLSDLSEQRVFPSDVLDAIPRSAASIGAGLSGTVADLIDRPGATARDILVAMGSAPARLAEGVNEGNEALFQGDLSRAGREGGNALLAAGETALLLAPGASAPLRSGISNTSRGRAARSLMDADPNLPRTVERASRLRASGQPVTVADLTTRQAQSRLKGAARRPGTAQDVAQDFFDPRQADQFPRVAEEVRSAFGVKGDFLDEIDLRQTQMQQRAKPLYQEAWATQTQVSDDLAKLLDRPPLRKAQREAQELAAIEGEALAPLARGAAADTKTLHFMRRALDDQIDDFRDPVTGKLNLNERGRALVQLRRDYNDAIKAANPAFREADQVWSEGTSAINAMRLGERAAKATSETKVRSLIRDGVSEADRDLFELGFAQGLEESLGKGGSPNANVTLKLLSPEKRKIIRTALGDERGQAFIDRMQVENLMTRARNTISPNVGSDTAENLQQSTGNLIAILSDIMTGSPAAATRGALRSVGGRKLADQLAKRQQEVDNALLKMATEDPEKLLRLIREVEADRAARYAIPDLNLPARAGAAAAESVTAQRQDATALQGPLQ